MISPSRVSGAPRITPKSGRISSERSCRRWLIFPPAQAANQSRRNENTRISVGKFKGLITLASHHTVPAHGAGLLPYRKTQYKQSTERTPPCALSESPRIQLRLRLRRFAKKPKQQMQHRQRQRSKKRRPERRHREPRHKLARKPQNPRIDHQKKQPKRQDPQRQRNDLQKQPQRRIQQTNHHHRNKSGDDIAYFKPLHEMRNNQQSQGIQNPVQKQTKHRPALLVRLKSD